MRASHPRVAVVTGGSAGVGRAVARRFARAGMSVALIARGNNALQAARAEMESFGARAMVVVADVANADAVLAAARTIETELGPIDVWVNNAMATVYSPVVAITPDEFRRVTEVTYLGVVHGTMAALKLMQPRDRGVIVQVGSSLAYRGIPLQSAYCGAKHAIRGFTDSLRAELIHDRSRIALTMVQLPAVNTPQFDWARSHRKHTPRPVPPVFQPELAAETIYRAACRPRRELWLGFSTLQVILGSMVAPGILDRFLAKHAYRGQETPRPLPSGRQDNLMAPVSGLHRARGSFGQEARADAFVTSDSGARFAIAMIGLSIFVAGTAMAMRRRRAGGTP